MDTTSNTMRLPPDLAQDLAALDKRSRSLLTKGKVAAGVSLTAAAGAAIAYGWAYAVAPSVALSGVHIPPEVLAAFSNAVGGQPWESATSALTGVLTGAIPKTLAVLAVLIGGIAAAFKGDLKLVIMPLGLAIPLFVVPALLGGLFGEPGGERASDRAVFERHAENANREALANMLSKADVAPDAYQYVIAQATIAQAHKNDAKIDGDALKALQQQVAAVQFALANGSKLTFDGKAMYALETSATGQPRSAPAKRYYADALESAQSKRSIASSALTSALIFGVAGAALSFVGRGMRRRVDRLSALVSPAVAAAAGSRPAARDVSGPAPSYGSKAPSKRRLQDDDRAEPPSASGSALGMAAVGVTAALVADALSPDTDPPRSGTSCASADDYSSDAGSGDSGGDGGGGD